MYQLWSGFIPALAVVSLVGGLWSHYKHVNCHVHRCWRVGRYIVRGYKVCHRHHPDDGVTRRGVDHGAVVDAWTVSTVRPRE